MPQCPMSGTSLIANPNTATTINPSAWSTSVYVNTYEPPKFTITQSSDGEWNFTVKSKNKKFIKSILKAMIEDYEDLELEETLDLMKKKSEISDVY